MQKITLFIICLFLLSGCGTFSGIGSDISSLFGHPPSKTETQIQQSMNKIDSLEEQKLQVASDGLYEMTYALNQDPKKENNPYELAALKVAAIDIAPNLPNPSSEGIQKAQERVKIEITFLDWSKQDIIKQINDLYTKDIDANKKIQAEIKIEQDKLSKLNQQNEQEKAAAILKLQNQVNKDNAQIIAQEQKQINTIFAGIGSFCVVAGVLLIVFTPMKKEGSILIGLGVCIAPMGLIYASPWFKWISGIGFSTLFITVIIFVIRAFAGVKVAKYNKDIAEVFVESTAQLKVINPDCYGILRPILDNELSSEDVNPLLKTEIDKRIDDLINIKKSTK